MTTHPETSITVFVVHPNGTHETKNLPIGGGTALRGLQGAVGGFIERIGFDTTDGYLDLWVDEDGMPKRLSLNLMAMWITARLRGSRKPFSAPILGTGVFTASDEDGNTRSLTPAMLRELERLADSFTCVRIPAARRPGVHV